MMRKLRVTDLPEVYNNEKPLDAARRICELFPEASETLSTRELCSHKKSLTERLKNAYSLEIRQTVHCCYTLPPQSYIERNGGDEVYLVIKNKGDGSRTRRYRDTLLRLGLAVESDGKFKIQKEFAELLELMDSKGYRNFRYN
jgi:hypothetical protein